MDLKNYISRSAAGLLATGAYNTVRDLVSRQNQSHSAVLSDPPFANPMAYSKPVYSRRSMKKGRRHPVRRTYQNLRSDIVPMRRTAETALVGAVGIAGLSYSTDISLSAVWTNDLIAAYSHYRIRKVVAEIQPNLDAGNVGPGSNYVLHAYAACDPNGFMSASISDIQRLDNHKYTSIPSGRKMIYTFYPKAVNTMVGVGASNAQVGSYTVNPWIALSNTGVTVPHKTFLLHVGTLGVASPVDMHVTYTLYFDVKMQR